jgi:hypothetical protein
VILLEKDSVSMIQVQVGGELVPESPFRKVGIETRKGMKWIQSTVSNKLSLWATGIEFHYGALGDNVEQSSELSTLCLKHLEQERWGLSSSSYLSVTQPWYP